MGTCKHCKWWEVDFIGVCDFVNTIHSEEESTRFEVEATATDDQGLDAFLHTGPDFVVSTSQ